MTNMAARVHYRFSGKPGSVTEFDGCQGNVRELMESQKHCRAKLSIASLIQVWGYVTLRAWCMLTTKAGHL